MVTRECNPNSLHSLWNYQLDWRIEMACAIGIVAFTLLGMIVGSIITYFSIVMGHKES